MCVCLSMQCLYMLTGACIYVYTHTHAHAHIDRGAFTGEPTVELVERLLKENQRKDAQLQSARRLASSSRQVVCHVCVVGVGVSVGVGIAVDVGMGVGVGVGVGHATSTGSGS